MTLRFLRLGELCSITHRRLSLVHLHSGVDTPEGTFHATAMAVYQSVPDHKCYQQKSEVFFADEDLNVNSSQRVPPCSDAPPPRLMCISLPDKLPCAN